MTIIGSSYWHGYAGRSRWCRGIGHRCNPFVRHASGSRRSAGRQLPAHDKGRPADGGRPRRGEIYFWPVPRQAEQFTQLPKSLWPPVPLQRGQVARSRRMIFIMGVPLYGGAVHGASPRSTAKSAVRTTGVCGVGIACMTALLVTAGAVGWIGHPTGTFSRPHGAG